MTRSAPAAPRRGAFSLIEMLVALTISSALLAATLSALDASFKQYKSTTESASTHVVSRIVVHRTLALVRTGVDFRPRPDDPYSPADNPVIDDFVEFTSQPDLAAANGRVTRLEFRPGPTNNTGEPTGPGSLWYVLKDDYGGAGTVLEEHELLAGVRDIVFTLRFDPVSDRCDQATVDMTVEPNDSEDLRIGVLSDPGAPETIRLVATASPRQTF